MKSLSINSVFYSNKNLNLAYNLKLCAREVGIDVCYAFSVPELAKQLNNNIISVIFVDSETICLNDNIIEFIKSYPVSKNPIIVCLNSEEEEDCKEINKLDIDYSVCVKNLLTELKLIKPQLSHNHYIKVSKSYNFAEINMYLSEYLLHIGISAKHIGFTYIKQCIEYLLMNNTIVKPLHSFVYPAIAIKNNTQPHSVERNIRNCIKYACKTNTILQNEVCYLFKNNSISNRAFLCYLLDRVLNKFSYNLV